MAAAEPFFAEQITALAVVLINESDSQHIRFVHIECLRACDAS